MCLKSISGKPMVAENDIVVYKCLRAIKERYSSDSDPKMCTVFLDIPLTHEEAFGKVSIKPREKDAHVERVDTPSVYGHDCMETVFNVGRGYIHAYIDYDQAKQFVKNHFIGKDWYFPVIVEAVIPKGTEYFKGVDSYGTACIAAKELRVAKYRECIVDREVKDYYDFMKESKKNKTQRREKDPFE